MFDFTVVQAMLWSQHSSTGQYLAKKTEYFSNNVADMR